LAVIRTGSERASGLGRRQSPSSDSLSIGAAGHYACRISPTGDMMDIRPLTESYAVAPQIAPEDLPAIKAAGFTAVIDNRPDGEVPGHLHAVTMQAAAEKLGLAFVVNPIIGGAMTMANVSAQRAAMQAANGPVLAYCASGNRSSQVWALAQAGQMTTDELVGIPARFGYQLEGLRGQIDMLAQQG
jgi:uncharacterized protein (TIGR01244 family)